MTEAADENMVSLASCRSEYLSSGSTSGYMFLFEQILSIHEFLDVALLLFGVLEDGLSSNGVPRSTAPGGISNPEKRMSCGTQCPNPQSLTSGPLTQKQNGLRTTEAKRDAKRMSAKEVTINVTDSIRQADRSRRISKNCVN
ncbi:brain and acute leukemia cytoplasmic protein [Puma concolor]|uniref:Brain and acute leukemia cytoplasmic protein n=1 Tax=Puma concolor TaxID=9696 RepID=A0A6P6HRA8_PUMCO|nr:brain and acute leukemia cytoplasmic protein [Puma concolor]